jgi:hypothetical protein
MNLPKRNLYTAMALPIAMNKYLRRSFSGRLLLHSLLHQLHLPKSNVE